MPESRRGRRTSEALIAQGPGARRFFRIGQVQSLTVLATVNLSVLPVFLLDFVAEEIPALQVAGAEFSLCVFFAASAHPWRPPLHLGAVAEGADQFGHRHGLVRYRVCRVRHMGITSISGGPWPRCAKL